MFPATRVMVIDDEPAFTRLLKTSVEGRGSYLVQVENDPAHAMATARLFRPDVVLVDIVMQGMDGGDVVAAFQADPALKDIPIVYLTATVTPTEVSSSHGVIGGSRFLAKPVNLGVLLGCIDQIVAARRAPHLLVQST